MVNLKNYMLSSSGSRNYSVSSGANNRYSGNSILSGRGAMPAKFGSAAGTSMFSMARNVYRKDAGGGQNFFDSSQLTYLKKNNAIGQSSYTSQNLAFSGKDNNAVNQSLRRVRNKGYVAPKKKGYYYK